MIKTLDSVTLKNGQKMLIKLFVPPEPEYAWKFKHFMRYLDNENIRSVSSRVDGKYSNCAEDRYFIGEIDGKIAGQVWFGWGKHKSPAANFGQVYVDPDYRGLDITSTIMKYWNNEFTSSSVLGAMCTCSIPKIRALYMPFGFRQTYSDSNRLYCPGKQSPENFKDLSDSYYQPASDIQVISGSMEYRHEIDCLLKFTMELNKWKSDRIFVSSAVTSFQDAIFKQEDGRGQIFVALTEKGHCIGWSFCLAPLPDKSATFFDYELHPSYRHLEENFIKESCKKWIGSDTEKLYATCPMNSEKVHNLSNSGFQFIRNLTFSKTNEIALLELSE